MCTINKGGTVKKIILIMISITICLAWAGLYVNFDKRDFAGYKDLMEKASANGKYINLLHVINVPEDIDGYGTFCDWGYWYCDVYAGEQNLLPGFWVYVHPNWYIWEKRADEQGLPARANAKGKYITLLHILKVHEDVKIYGAYHDWGFSETYAYAGYEDLTPGYWVYVEPYWYIWAQTSIPEGNT
jgi:hypothetical protein